MSSRFPPLEYRVVAKGLKVLGFVLQQKGSTGHEQWKKIENGRLFKVTVSKHSSPFGPDMIKSFASQAGVSKKEFYKVCGK